MMKMLSDNTKSSLTDNLRGLPILSYHWFFDIDNSLIILNPIPAGPFAQRIPAGGGSYGPLLFPVTFIVQGSFLAQMKALNAQI